MLTCQRLINSFLGSFLFAMALFSLTSCGNDGSSENINVSLAQVQPVESTKEADQRFLIRARELKYHQIMLSKLAFQRSGNEEVKSLARMVEDRNRDEMMALGSLAIIKSIKVPTVPPQSAHAAYDTLNQFAVEEFDYAYLSSVISGYNDGISHFESASYAKLDPEIQAKAAAMLSDMRSQQTMAKDLNARMNPVSELVR